MALTLVLCVLLLSWLRRREVQVQPHFVQHLQERLLLPVPLQHRVQSVRLGHGLRPVEECGQGGGRSRPPPPPHQVPPEGRHPGSRGRDLPGDSWSGDFHRLRDGDSKQGRQRGEQGPSADDALCHEHRHRLNHVSGVCDWLRHVQSGPQGARLGQEPHSQPGRGAAGGSLTGTVHHQLLQHRRHGRNRSQGLPEQAQSDRGHTDGDPAGPAELFHR